MKNIWVTVDELASALNLSAKTLRRAYRNDEIPMVRIGRLVRFDIEDVKHAMQGNRHEACRRHLGAALERRATAGNRRRRAAQSPRSVKRGRKFQPSTRRSV